jgi:hypothetical protein
VESVKIDLRIAEAHLAACDCVQHPRRERDDVAGLNLDMDELTQRPLLAALAAGR